MTKTSSDDPRLQLAREAVGAIRILEALTLPPRLLHVVDSDGQTYIAKRHDNAHRFDQELRAYTTYLTMLRDLTPRLVAHHAGSHTLLLSLVPGRDCDDLETNPHQHSQAHCQAGVSLRRLHDSTTGRHPPPSADLAERTRQWTDHADRTGLLTRGERHHLDAAAIELSRSTMEGAVCHLDFQPRNWRMNTDGSFYILDFEHTRPDARVRDFARLEHRHWSHQPHLREAFFAGYGRSLTRAEQRLLHLFGAIEAVTALVRGHEKDDQDLALHGRTLLARLF